jgi:hypothetical protein
MMSDHANKLRAAGQPASSGPNQTLLTRTGRGGAQLIKKCHSCK